jgi:hypothetical protein
MSKSGYEILKKQNMQEAYVLLKVKGKGKAIPLQALTGP